MKRRDYVLEFAAALIGGVLVVLLAAITGVVSGPQGSGVIGTLDWGPGGLLPAITGVTASYAIGVFVGAGIVAYLRRREQSRFWLGALGSLLGSAVAAALFTILLGLVGAFFVAALPVLLVAPPLLTVAGLNLSSGHRSPRSDQDRDA